MPRKRIDDDITIHTADIIHQGRSLTFCFTCNGNQVERQPDGKLHFQWPCWQCHGRGMVDPDEENPF